MRPLTKARFKTNKAFYNPYSSSKDDLLNAIGEYCSFCERKGFSSALDVEHIRHKNLHTQRTSLWRNFLLACKNCNSIKGEKSILNMYFPIVHDTFIIFEYTEHGEVLVNPAVPLNTTQYERVVNLINLIGLDRMPGHPQYSIKDKRWSDRRTTWSLAIKYLTQYQNNNSIIDYVVDLAKQRGNWSIWMTVFKNEPAVIQRLKSDFPGTVI